MRFRFTIRDLLWLTLVVALIISWRLDRNRYAAPSLWNSIPTGRAETDQRRDRDEEVDAVSRFAWGNNAMMTPDCTSTHAASYNWSRAR
jgi:hypothetical protein